MTKQTPLEQARKIPVPEPNTGEVVILPSVEALCVWMQLNNQKAVRWYGGVLVVTAQGSRVEPAVNCVNN